MLFKKEPTVLRSMLTSTFTFRTVTASEVEPEQRSTWEGRSWIILVSHFFSSSTFDEKNSKKKTGRGEREREKLRTIDDTFFLACRPTWIELSFTRNSYTVPFFQTSLSDLYFSLYILLFLFMRSWVFLREPQSKFPSFLAS